MSRGSRRIVVVGVVADMSRGSRRTSKAVDRSIEPKRESAEHVTGRAAWLGERAAKASILKGREVHAEDVLEIPVSSIGENGQVIGLKGALSLPLFILSTVDLELNELQLIFELTPGGVEVLELAPTVPQVAGGRLEHIVHLLRSLPAEATDIRHHY